MSSGPKFWSRRQEECYRQINLEEPVDVELIERAVQRYADQSSEQQYQIQKDRGIWIGTSSEYPYLNFVLGDENLNPLQRGLEYHTLTVASTLWVRECYAVGCSDLQSQVDKAAQDIRDCIEDIINQ
ncbi:MAG: hypothetical protein MAG795_00370 [Candidatus Woesearchaeota archaeon]|nr:hypothetical protein [Candidatus Woesearchaeota archaeon]